MTLRNRILISVLAGVLATIFLLGTILLVRVNRNFEQYLAIEQQLQMADLVQQIENVYQRSTVSSGELEHLADSRRIYLEVFDKEGNRAGVYDGIPQSMTMRGNYVEREVPVLNTMRQQVGSLKIGYWDHSLLSQSAENFTRSLSGSILLAMLAAFVFSFFASLYVSRRITRPVQQIMTQTDRIRNGDYSMRPKPQGFAREFDQLTANINSLSDALQSQETYRKKYAQDIAHELRTPVTALKLHIAAIRDGLRPANAENLELLNFEVNRLSRMIEMLKTSFEESKQEMPLQIEPVTLQELADELTASLLPLFSADEVELTVDVPPNALLHTDKERLRQILYNLLSNAKKAVDRGGHVRLFTQTNKKQLRLILEDDGIGISAADLPHIFDRFYRADTARNTKQGGTGLGLSIVKSHVQALKGTIQVESTPGEGTRFTLVFPVQFPNLPEPDTETTT